jgi:hypothetical protein
VTGYLLAASALVMAVAFAGIVVCFGILIWRIADDPIAYEAMAERRCAIIAPLCEVGPR